MKNSIAPFFAQDDAYMIAFFLREEPLWQLLKARFRLRRANKQEKLHLAVSALTRIKAGQQRQLAKRKKG